MSKETPNQNFELEIGFSKPETQKSSMESMAYSFINILNSLLKHESTVELDRDALGQKRALVKQGEEIIYSTSNQRELHYIEEYLKDPEDFIRKGMLKDLERQWQKDTDQE